MSDTTKKFTNAEFKALGRYSNGDVSEDLEMANIRMTESQIEKLTNDDQSRVFEYQEEMRYMMADLASEFG